MLMSAIGELITGVAGPFEQPNSPAESPTSSSMAGSNQAEHRRLAALPLSGYRPIALHAPHRPACSMHLHYRNIGHVPSIITLRNFGWREAYVSELWLAVHVKSYGQAVNKLSCNSNWLTALLSHIAHPAQIFQCYAARTMDRPKE
jgi:hypothetical protein